MPEDDLPPHGTKEREAALARLRRKRRKAGTLGLYDRVPVYAARHALTYLFDHGFTYTRIQALTGVDKDLILKIMHSPDKKWINYETHLRICRLDLEAVVTKLHRSEGRVDVDPYRTYLRRLMAAGWSKGWVLARLGIPEQNDHMYRNRCKYITPKTADDLEKLFKEIGDRVGPSKSAAQRARRMGYKPPAFYDEEFIDLKMASLGLVPEPEPDEEDTA
jgi:hypothetical protein